MLRIQSLAILLSVGFQLVLSGRGARGFSPIGVLKVLRDMKVPIDRRAVP